MISYPAGRVAISSKILFHSLRLNCQIRAVPSRLPLTNLQRSPPAKEKKNHMCFTKMHFPIVMFLKTLKKNLSLFLTQSSNITDYSNWYFLQSKEFLKHQRLLKCYIHTHILMYVARSPKLQVIQGHYLLP